MMAQAGHPMFNAEGILQKGVILRHLALPGHVDDSFAVLDQMAAWNDAALLLIFTAHQSSVNTSLYPL